MSLYRKMRAVEWNATVALDFGAPILAASPLET
jgi:hypothetical protein